MRSRPTPSSRRSTGRVAFGASGRPTSRRSATPWTLLTLTPFRSGCTPRTVTATATETAPSWTSTACRWSTLQHDRPRRRPRKGMTAVAMARRRPPHREPPPPRRTATRSRPWSRIRSILSTPSLSSPFDASSTTPETPIRFDLAAAAAAVAVHHPLLPVQTLKRNSARQLATLELPQLAMLANSLEAPHRLFLRATTAVLPRPICTAPLASRQFPRQATSTVARQQQ